MKLYIEARWLVCLLLSKPCLYMSHGGSGCDRAKDKWLYIHWSPGFHLPTQTTVSCSTAESKVHHHSNSEMCVYIAVYVSVEDLAHTGELLLTDVNVVC